MDIDLSLSLSPVSFSLLLFRFFLPLVSFPLLTFIALFLFLFFFFLTTQTEQLELAFQPLRFNKAATQKISYSIVIEDPLAKQQLQQPQPPQKQEIEEVDVVQTQKNEAKKEAPVVTVKNSNASQGTNIVIETKEGKQINSRQGDFNDPAAFHSKRKNEHKRHWKKRLRDRKS